MDTKAEHKTDAEVFSEIIKTDPEFLRVLPPHLRVFALILAQETNIEPAYAAVTPSATTVTAAHSHQVKENGKVNTTTGQ